ncbi:MAG: BatA domain-containing protein [Pirellulales bacterium]
MPPFLHPWLLAGMAAVAVPVVLHLIMRQKPRRLEFPALRFVRQRQISNTRRLRLRHLLLMLLRMGAICLLALALARPTITASGVLVEREAPVAAALVFDTSPRMDYRHANQTRLEASREFGRWLLGQFPADSQVAVLESRLDSAVFQVDTGAANERIERLETSARVKPLVDVLEEGLRLLATSDNPQKEVYIFTDLSRAAWDTAAAGRLQQRITELRGVGLYVIDVGVESPRDFGLGELALSGQVLSRNSTLSVRTDISRTGPAASRAVELFLLDELGRKQPRGRESFDVADGESQAVSFSLSGLEVGTHQGFVRIAGEDGLKWDDTRYFTVEVKNPWPVLLAAPSPVADYAFFLSEALAPEHFRKNDSARFRCDTVVLDQLADQPLENYPAVCLLDPTPLSTAVWQKLADYAAGGGGVAIFLGRNAQPVETFNQAAAQELLPGKLAQQSRHPDGDVYLAPENFQHPLLARFRRRAGTIPWDAFPVYRYWRLEELGEGAGVVVPYSDRQPAIVERPLGRGRVITVTTPVSDAADDTAWNLLPTGFEPWPFVMLSNETLYYLVGNSDSQLNYRPGQTATLRLEPGSTVTNYLLTMPTSEQTRRTSHQNEGVITESATEWVGNYRMQAGGREGGLDRGFSVNLPPEAGDLTRLPPDGLNAIFGSIEYRIARTHDDLIRDRTFSQVGRELFPYLMVLLALFMGLEHALANRFYREEFVPEPSKGLAERVLVEK